ncbi:hypothetical protein [Streptomyces sp. ADMS]|uniref:hypothetical protein n=1 Tax=Streptomyces sp. ADMS TaxID=3071415 RepID=UPI0039963AF1
MRSPADRYGQHVEHAHGTIIGMREDCLQSGYGGRLEWGPTGAQHLAREVSCLVVVDVLSFTTSVSVAVEAGARVFPYPWHDGTATAFAEQKDAGWPSVGEPRPTLVAFPGGAAPGALRRPAGAAVPQRLGHLGGGRRHDQGSGRLPAQRHHRGRMARRAGVRNRRAAGLRDRRR